MVTLAVSESVTNNRSLFIAGYFYGLNTMFLTLRAFGHVMETTKQIGPIQIALFHILSDLVTIFWQFIAAILAFSIAITKVYVAEKSLISEDSREELWVGRRSWLSQEQIVYLICMRNMMPNLALLHYFLLWKCRFPCRWPQNFQPYSKVALFLRTFLFFNSNFPS